MKRSIHSCLRAACVIALALGAVPGPAVADDSAVVLGQVRIDVLMVSMPEEKFVALLPDLLDHDKLEKAVPQILDAVKNKEMTLEGWPMLVTKSGQRAIIETLAEMSDDQPPTLVPEKTPKTTYPDYLPVNTSPVTFYLRTVGVSLEVEPIITKEGLIDLNVEPRHTELLGYDHFLFPKKKQGDPSTTGQLWNGPWQPLFFDAETITSITLRSGRHTLLGVHKKEKPADTVEIFILCAEDVSVR